MTPADVAELVNAAPMPPGYSLEVTPQRKYVHRSLWDVRIFVDGKRVWGRAYYNVAAGIRAAQNQAWAMRWPEHRTLADDLREHPRPVDTTPHVHFHGKPRHAHEHVHPDQHAHSTRTDDA